MLDALPDWTLSPPADPSPDAPLQATLMPPVATPPPSPPAPAASPPVRERPTARPTRPTPPEFVPESMEPVPEIRVDEVSGPSTSAAPSAPVDPPAAWTPATSAPPTPAVDPPSPPPPPAPAPAAPAVSAVAPQSARLDYKVVYVDVKSANPIRYYGIGSIDWAIAEGRYRSDLVAAVDFLLFKVNVLASHSEGAIEPGGLAPDRYTETPRKRSTVATSFNRDARQTVSFSASPATVPLLPGTQDRLSVLFQIGALLLAADQGTAAPAPHAPGTTASPSPAVSTEAPSDASAGPVGASSAVQSNAPALSAIEIPVAGVRGDVDPWRFDVLGVETVEAAGVPLTTTHLRRAPRAGSGDRTIDVWVATQNGGYPARVLYTETNGSTIEMTLSRIAAVAR